MKTRTLATALGAVAGLALVGFASSRLRGRAVARRSPPRGRFVEVGGERLHYLQQGSGPDVLLIHGAAMAADEMMLALGEAFPGRRVTAIDRPGHGHSSKGRRPSVHDQAALFHEAAVQLGLRTPVVIGHSLGGAVALAYGDDFADEVAGIVAVAPLAYPGWGPAHVGRAIRGAPLLGPLLSNTVQALTDPLMMRGALRLIFSPQKPTAAFRRTVDVDLLARPHAMVADGADFVRASMDLEQLSERYAAYRTPVHVVVGEKDHVLNVKRQGGRLGREAANVAITRLPGLGHMVHHFAPEAVVQAVEEVETRAFPTWASEPADEIRPAAA